MCVHTDEHSLTHRNTTLVILGGTFSEMRYRSYKNSLPKDLNLKYLLFKYCPINNILTRNLTITGHFKIKTTTYTISK